MNNAELRKAVESEARAILGDPSEMDLTEEEFEQVIDQTMDDDTMREAIRANRETEEEAQRIQTNEAYERADEACDHRNNACNAQFVEIANLVTGRQVKTL